MYKIYIHFPIKTKMSIFNIFFSLLPFLLSCFLVLLSSFRRTTGEKESIKCQRRVLYGKFSRRMKFNLTTGRKRVK